MARQVVDGWTVPGFTHVRELGSGASGRVVLAVDDVTQTKVAIKYLDRRLDGDEAFLSRFRLAARRLAQIEDPNLVDFYDFVEAPHGGAAIVMEWVDGVSLRRVVDAQGPTGPLAALSMLGGVLVGLAAAHAKDLVHGSLRPANVLVDGDGNGRLVDLALAPPGTEAQSGPVYAAPELWDGVAAGPASDIYAATAIFYECLTGHPPFSGRSQSALAKAHREAPVPADEVPGPLRDLILAGLAKKPSERPASAADFLGAVEEAAVAAYGPAWEAQGRSRITELVKQTQALPEPAPARGGGRAPAKAPAAKSGGRGRLVALLVAGVVVVGGAGGAAALTLGGGGDDDKKTVQPPPSPATSGTPSPALPAGPGPVNPAAAAALATQVEQAVARTPSGAFSYRRTGGAAIKAQGSFALAAAASPSYQMSVSGQGADVRRPAQARLVADTTYLRSRNTWRPAGANPRTRGYVNLVSHVRWSSSVSNVTTLLRTSTSLRKTGASTYQGAVPLARLAQAPGLGPLYAEVARATGAQQVTFVVQFDSAMRPLQIRVRAAGSGAKPRSQLLHTSYSRWGQKVSIPAPRGAG
ncbi:serine/threonine-protein kinase [Actinomadura miaoliensis]